VHLTDGDHIRGLLARYCHLIDAGDFAGVGRLMARATLCTEDGSRLAAGADEVAGLYAGLVKLHDDGTPGTQHVVANTVFDQPEEDGSVRVTSTYLVLQATATVPLQPIMTGTYVDTFASDEDGWHFTERRFGVGRSGLLDQHLTVDLGAGA
jgi:hypothetical protein